MTYFEVRCPGGNILRGVSYFSGRFKGHVCGQENGAGDGLGMRLPYTFESRIHKVTVELPNIVEGLVGVQLCTLYQLQICQIDGIANASGIVLPCEGTIMRFIFQFAFLQLQGFSASASPRNQACVTRPSPLWVGSEHETRTTAR